MIAQAGASGRSRRLGMSARVSTRNQGDEAWTTTAPTSRSPSSTATTSRVPSTTGQRPVWRFYFSATLDAAVWGAELARGEGTGRIYVVEPTGPFEDDPNLTDKRFPGNPTKSYRTREPLQIVAEVEGWEGHPPQVLQAMRDRLAELERQGLATIED